MSAEEWTRAYDESWRTYYTYEHCETIMRRAAALRSLGSNLIAMTWFKGCIELENVHPVEGGMLRLKFRRDRRPSLPMESVWSFYPRYLAEVLRKTASWGWLYLRLRKIYLRVKSDPGRYQYTDAAITAVTDDEAETHEMFQNVAAKAYVDQERRLEKIRHGVAA